MARTSLPGCAGLITRPYQMGGARLLGAAVTVAFSLIEPQELRAQAELWPEISPWLTDIGTLDAGLPKPGGEWLLAGESHAPGTQARKHWTASVALGSSHKRLTLHGPREWSHAGITEAGARSVALRWTGTWGGPEIVDNPAGCGTRASTPLVAPQIERPEVPWQGPDASCEPAGTLPLPMSHPARLPGGGAYGSDYLATCFPGYPADADARCFCLAPLDQRVDSAWVGDESFVLEHWHPERPRIASRLPGLSAALHVSGAEGAFTRVPLALSTVWFFPNALIGVLVFHGHTPVAQLDGADVQRQIVGLERLGDPPRSVSDYAGLWQTRTARTVESALASMDDSALIPAGFVTRFDLLDRNRIRHDFQARQAATMDAAFEDARSQMEERLAEPARFGAATAHDRMVLRRLQRGMAAHRKLQDEMVASVTTDPAQQLAALRQWTTKARLEARQRIDDLASLLENPSGWQVLSDEAAPLSATPAAQAATLRLQLDGLQAQLEQAEAGIAADGQARAGLDQLRRLLAAGPAGKKPKAGEPTPHSDEVEAGLQSWIERNQALSAMAPASPGALLAQARALTQESPDLGADPGFRPIEGAVRPLSPPSVWIAGGHVRGRSYSRLDLRDLDLSGLRLDDVMLIECDLRGTHLGHAQTVGCTLLNCDLSDAAWPQGDIQRTRLINCRLDRLDASDLRVELSHWLHCDASSSRWQGARLTDNIIHGGNWQASSFERATMERSVMNALQLSAAIFSAVEASRCSWGRCDMAGAVFAYARLTRCGFVEGELPTDWRESGLSTISLREGKLRASQWSGARLEAVDVSGADLRDADLHGVQAAFMQALRTDLRGSSLRDARIEQGMWLAADLRGTDLRGATLEACWLADVLTDEHTRLQGTTTATSAMHPKREEARWA